MYGYQDDFDHDETVDDTNDNSSPKSTTHLEHHLHNSTESVKENLGPENDKSSSDCLTSHSLPGGFESNPMNEVQKPEKYLETNGSDIHVTPDSDDAKLEVLSEGRFSSDLQHTPQPSDNQSSENGGTADHSLERAEIKENLRSLEVKEGRVNVHDENGGEITGNEIFHHPEEADEMFFEGEWKEERKAPKTDGSLSQEVAKEEKNDIRPNDEDEEDLHASEWLPNKQNISGDESDIDREHREMVSKPPVYHTRQDSRTSEYSQEFSVAEDRTESPVYRQETQRAESPISRGSHSSVTSSDEGIDPSVAEPHPALVKRLDKECAYLSKVPLRDYEYSQSLLETLKHTKDHLTHNDQTLQNMVTGLEEIAKALHNLIASVTLKINEEKCESMIQGHTADHPYTKVERMKLLALEAELREEIGRAKVELTEAVVLSTELKRKTIEARQMVLQAQQEAEAANLLVAEAKMAALAKAKEEEFEKRRKDERSVKEAELTRRRLDEEERKILERERVKAALSAADLTDPNNWPLFIYKNHEASEFDAHYNCVLRVPLGLINQEEITVRRLSQITCDLPLGDNNELAGHVVLIQPDTHLDENTFEQPLSLLVPHCAPRSATRECVVAWKRLGSADWVFLETKDYHSDSLKDAKFVEARPNGFGTFAVISRLKQEVFTLTKKGGKFSSSVDSRVVISCRPGSFRVNASVALQIQPIDLLSVSEVKQRNEVCADLFSSSPIISLKSLHGAARPLSITAPLPAHQTKGKRPYTGVESSKLVSRPKSAVGFSSFTAEDREAEDRQHLLVWSPEGKWTLADDESISQNKKGDLITIDTKLVADVKLWLLRTKSSSSPARVEKMAAILHEYTRLRPVHFLMRQKQEDPTDVALSCTSVQRLDRTLRKLEEEGYTAGTVISSPQLLSEGQLLTVKFRGNLQPDEVVRLSLPFNSLLKTQINLYVAELDRFAQKGFNSYRGFAQFYATELIKKEIFDEADKRKVIPVRVEFVPTSTLLAEVLICLPKPEPEAPKPLKKAPVTIAPDGALDEAMLRTLAGDLGDEWKLLANYLNVKKTRIQSIMRNNVQQDCEQVIYDMLVTWMKRTPRSMDKVDKLCSGLAAVGRIDLADVLQDRCYDFKHQQFHAQKDARIAELCGKVLQSEDAVSVWMQLGEQLDQPITNLLNIENSQVGGAKEKCHDMLRLWKEENRQLATPYVLIKALKRLRLLDLAGELSRTLR